MLERMIFEKIETRILVGILSFVGIMIMIGWVAINENGRMASFERQFQARSVERGAELFASNCSTCHGTDSRGLAGRAPGLNSPHLFGFDFTADARGIIIGLEAERTGLEQEQLTLATELPNATSARTEAINTRLGEIATRLGEIPDEIAVQEAAIDDILAQLVPATLAGYPSADAIRDNPGLATRLGQANWEGTLESYIYTTLVHGRTQTGEMWGGNVMQAWSQRTGGPLRDDQIQDLTNYILNFDKGNDWTIGDALAVGQYAMVPGIGGGEATAEAAGEDVDAVLVAWEENGIVGDAARGETIYNNQAPSEVGSLLGCSGCHMGGAQGPATELTWDNIVNERLLLDQYVGYTPEQYIVESILHPNNYIAPGGWQAGQMPQNFSDRVSVQDLADIVAYLETYSSGG